VYFVPFVAKITFSHSFAMIRRFALSRPVHPLMLQASQVSRIDCATLPSPPDFPPSADDKHSQKKIGKSPQAKRCIDKVMNFCQKESEKTIKKAKESNRWFYFCFDLP
jgi:hypothetical protein